MPHLRANNVELYYQRHPQPGKPRLLLSHSLFFDHSMFAPLIAELGEAFDIVVYDHRGQGASERAAPLDMDTLADDAAALIDALDLAPCFVAGNSMGGFVALRLAARYPERLAGCAIMGSSADLEHQLPVFVPLVEDLGRNGAAPHIDTLMHIMFGDSSLNDPACASLTAHWRERMQALGPDIGAAAEGVIRRPSMLAELPGLRVPLLVLAGEQDHAYSVELSQQIAEVSGRGTVHVVPHAGHSLALEAPSVVAGYLRHFIARANPTDSQ